LLVSVLRHISRSWIVTRCGGRIHIFRWWFLSARFLRRTPIFWRLINLLNFLVFLNKFLMIRVISNILEMATCITDSILESLVLYFTLLNQIVSFLFICEEYVLILAVIFHVFQRNQSIFRLLIFTEFWICRGLTAIFSQRYDTWRVVTSIC